MLATIAALTDTGVRADERREMQKAVAEAQAAEERTKRAEARVAGLKDTIELVEAANEDLAARVVELETALQEIADGVWHCEYRDIALKVMAK